MERSFDINSIMLFKIWNEIITNYIQAIKDIIFFNSSLLVVALFMSFYAFSVIFLFGNWIGDRGSAFISIFFTFFSLLIVSIYIVTKFWDFWRHYFNYIFFAKPFDGGGFEVPVMRVQFGNWFSFTDFNISWGFIFDPLGLSMMWVVLFITFIVQIYCLDYMHGDPFISRFYAYLSIFSFFMLLLVVSDNYVQIFLGWEGVGLASFMLISFWSTRKDAVYAGMKALFVNRFGDVFFIWFMVIALKEFQSLNFVDINLICTSLDLSQRVEMVLLGFTLVIAAMAKSAQLGLHMWLPDAMEGPTPVSALIHAATMVTAGIYVVIRASFILIKLPIVLSFMSIIGGLTVVFGASIACVQFDIKKVVAYSTCSQLGYMMIACGSGNFIGAFFHLVNHAFFKALLFLCCGSVIHGLSNEQDMRRMGSLVNFMPFTTSAMLFGSFALAGVPFFSGFYSKDNILEFSYLVNSSFSYIGFGLGVLGTFFTAFYSFRLLYMVFFSRYNGIRPIVHKIHEPPVFMGMSLIVLIIPSVFFGIIFKDAFVGYPGSFVWPTSINYLDLSTQPLPIAVSQAPMIFTSVGFISAYFIYCSGFNYVNKFYFWFSKSWVYSFLVRKWYFDDLMNFGVKYVAKFVYFGFWQSFERGFLNYFGPRGMIKVFGRVAKFSSSFINPGRIYLRFIMYFFIFIFFVSAVCTFQYLDVSILEHIWIVCLIQVCVLIYYIVKLKVYLPLSILGNCYCFGLRVIKLGV